MVVARAYQGIYPMWLERLLVSGRVRRCAAASTSETDYVRRLRSSGLLARPIRLPSCRDVLLSYEIARPRRRGAPPLWIPASLLGRGLGLSELRAEQWFDAPQATLEAIFEWADETSEGVAR